MTDFMKDETFQDTVILTPALHEVRHEVAAAAIHTQDVDRWPEGMTLPPHDELERNESRIDALVWAVERYLMQLTSVPHASHGEHFCARAGCKEKGVTSLLFPHSNRTYALCATHMNECRDIATLLSLYLEAHDSYLRTAGEK